MMLQQFCADYCRRRLDLKPSSQHQLRVAVRVFSRWLGRPAQTGDLNTESVLNWLRWLLTERAPATVNAKRRLLLAMWRDASRCGLVKAPGPIPRVKEPRRTPEAWTPQEMGRLCAAAADRGGDVAGLPACQWWLSFILAIYDTGGRVGAIKQVRPSDLSLTGRWLLLRAEHQKDGRDRLCSLHEQTIQAIESIYCERRELLWPWPYSRVWLERRFKRLCGVAGLRVGRHAGGLFHKLRRTSGSLVEANGGDGARHLGNSRGVFERHYLDPRLLGTGQVDLLPRPVLPE